MPSKRPTAQPDFSRLQTVLAQTKETENPLYQVVSQLIDKVRQLQLNMVAASETPAGSDAPVIIRPPSPSPGGTGDVVGPSSAVDNSVALYSGITGKLIKDSSQVIVDPTTGDIATVGNLIVGVTPALVGAIRLPNNQFIYARNAANTADVAVIGVDTNNRVVLSAPLISDLTNIQHTHQSNSQGGFLNAAAIASGTLADARLTVNVLKFTGGYPGGTVSYLRADGTFATPPGGGDVTGPGSSLDNSVTLYNGSTGKILKGQSNVTVNPGSGALTIAGDPVILLNQVNMPVNQRLWRIGVHGGTGSLTIYPCTDDGVNIAGTWLQVDRTGNLTVAASIYEKGRTTPVGHWIDVAYNSGNFGAASGVWTVPSANVITNRYTLIGKTLHMTMNVYGTSTNSITSSLNMFLPAGITIAKDVLIPIVVGQTGAGWTTGYVYAGAGTQYVLFRKDPQGTVSWQVDSGGTAVYASFTISIQ